MNISSLKTITARIPRISLQKDAALLIARFFIGIIFVMHAIIKLQIGAGVIGGFLGMIHIPFGVASAWLLIAIELVGGIALILGIYIRPAVRLLTAVLLIAIITVKFPIGLIGGPMQGPGYELDISIIAALLLLAYTGAGAYSLQSVLVRRGILKA